MTFDPVGEVVSKSLIGMSDDRERGIDRDYNLSLTAENTGHIMSLQAANIAATARASQANVAALERLRAEQSQSNEYLGSILQSSRKIEKGIINVREAIDMQTKLQLICFQRLNDGISVIQDGLATIYDGLVTVQYELAVVADRLSGIHDTLHQIEDVLRNPYETQVRELRDQAARWVKSGAKNTGQEQVDDFNDAFKLLEKIIENPLGNQDYATWFQIGWLRWKHFKDVPAAEQAFYRAMRLSAPRADLYHVMSLRHWAQMLYLLGKFEEAYGAIQRALKLNDEHDTLFDAARFAAVTGRTDEAIDFLDRCIDLRPTTFVAMFAEEDFLSIVRELVELAGRKLEQAREQCTLKLQEWQRLIEQIEDVAGQADCDLLPEGVTGIIQQLTGMLPNEEFLTVIAIRMLATDQLKAAPHDASLRLEHEMKERKRLTLELIADAAEKHSEYDCALEDAREKSERDSKVGKSAAFLAKWALATLIFLVSAWLVIKVSDQLIASGGASTDESGQIGFLIAGGIVSCFLSLTFGWSLGRDLIIPFVEQRRRARRFDAMKTDLLIEYSIPLAKLHTTREEHAAWLRKARNAVKMIPRLTEEPADTETKDVPRLPENTSPASASEISSA